MAPMIKGPPDDLAVIGRAAGRIRRFAEAIEQGHSFGLGPGEHDQPWAISFQRLAIPIYSSTFPRGYMIMGWRAIRGLCRSHDALYRRETASLQWSRIQMYLRSVSKAVREAALRDTAPPPPQSPNQLVPVMSPVMPFNSLAELLRADGVAALRDAGAVIEVSCGQLESSPLTEQECEWLSSISRGDRMVDIADASGYSERTLYRALNELWSRIGARNRSEAIALANKNGWLS